MDANSDDSWSERRRKNELSEAYIPKDPRDNSTRDSSGRLAYAPCNCSICFDLEQVAQLIEGIQCDKYSDSWWDLHWAQIGVWTGRTQMHQRHMPELYLTDTPVVLPEPDAVITASGRNVQERTELSPCACEKCETLFRRYREVLEADGDGVDSGERLYGLRLIVAAQIQLHPDYPLTSETEGSVLTEPVSANDSAAWEDSDDAEPLTVNDMASWEGSDGAANEADQHVEGVHAIRLFRGAQQRTQESGTTDMTHVMHGGHHNKFMVCDHCMAHGLPCNEASVCDQCQLFEQPCIHRWCRDSPTRKLLCLNNDCRYAHRDSVVAQNDDPRWIVLPGKLPLYLSRARIASRTFDIRRRLGMLSDTEKEVAQITLDIKQEEAVDELRANIAAEEGTMLTMRFSCSCQFESYDDQAQQDLEVTFGEPLPRLSNNPQLDDRLAHLNEFIPTAIDSEQASDVTTDSGDEDEVEDEAETSSSQSTESGDEEEDEEKQDIDDKDLDLDDGRDDTARQRAPLCPDCGKRNDHYSVPPCNHRTCIECALTLRLSRGDRTCIECGAHAYMVWSTASEDKLFHEMEGIRSEEGPQGIAAVDGGFDILFENAVIRKDTIWLLDQLPDIPVSRRDETAAFCLR
ncbi:unnamed protein product [Cercospora beticola]|nr:unnamed protein product [Cercospora beticola]